jgi:hypothetical protein
MIFSLVGNPADPCWGPVALRPQLALGLPFREGSCCRPVRGSIRGSVRSANCHQEVFGANITQTAFKVRLSNTHVFPMCISAFFQP